MKQSIQTYPNNESKTNALPACFHMDVWKGLQPKYEEFPTVYVKDFVL